MKKILLTFLILMASLAFASQFKLVEFRELPADFKAQREPVSDMDMNYCAVVKLEIDAAVVPQLKQKVYRKEKLTSGEIYYYVSATEDELTFTAPTYEPLSIDVEMETGVVYYTKLETIPEVELELVVEPQPDRVIIADKVYEPGIIKIIPGSYSLILEKEGYRSIQDSLEIGPNGASYNYVMVEADTEITEPEEETELEPEAVEVTEMETEPLTELSEVNMYEFNFKINQIQKLNNTLTIVMTITNLAEDREMDAHTDYYRSPTKIFDQNGNEYSVDTIKFANKRKQRNIKHKLVKNIPTKLELVFREINSDINKISLFQLGAWTQQEGYFKIQFRNLPVN